MRVRALYFLLPLLLSIAASASELSVKVVDPSSAAVSGAHVSLMRSSDSKALRTAVTSAQGTAQIVLPDSGSFQIRVLAPGFAAENLDVSSQREVTIKLRLAPAAETVVVTATRTPITGEAAIADVNTLTAEQLTTMNPPAAADAVRFLARRCRQCCGTARLAYLPIRSRRRVAIQQSYCRWRDGQRAGWDFRLRHSPAERSRTHGVRPRRAEHALRLRCHDERGPGLDADRQHSLSPNFAWAQSGGNFSTASGNASLAGARGRFDYNLFGGSIQHGRSVDQQRLLRFTRKAPMWARRLPIAARCVFVSAIRIRTPACRANGISTGLHCSRPNPSDWSQLNDILGSAELAVRRSLRMGASLHRFRLSLSLLRTESQRRSRARVRFPFE